MHQTIWFLHVTRRSTSPVPAIHKTMCSMALLDTQRGYDAYWSAVF
jgi:hypothetical protein